MQCIPAVEQDGIRVAGEAGEARGEGEGTADGAGRGRPEGDDDTTPPDNRSYRGRQIEKLKKQADRIESWLKENGERLGVSGKEIKSNMTDNESSKMVTSNGTVQGYNGQVLVDSRRQVIVHAEAFGTGHDHNLVPPMLDGAMENLERDRSLPGLFQRDNVRCGQWLSQQDKYPEMHG